MGNGKKFTYGGDPAARPIDAVRFLVGDTNPKRPLLDDREVAYAIAQNPDANLAAASLAEHLFGVFTSKGDFSVGPVSKSFSKVAELFKKKADQLRGEACLSAVPSFPATQIASNEALQQDNSLTDPNFTVGLSDNPFAVQLNDDLDEARFYGFNG